MLILKLSACLAFLFPVWSLASEVEAEFLFSNVFHKNLTGVETVYGEETKGLKEQTKAFIRYKRNQMPLKQKVLWASQCLPDVKSSIYCQYLLDSRKTAKDHDLAPVTEDDTPEDKSHWKAGDIASAFLKAEELEFKGVREGLMYRALKLFPLWNPLETIAEKLLTKEQCPSAQVLTAFGQKAEEFLPDVKFKSTAKAFYLRAIQCGDFENTIKARYRLAMLDIWDGKWEDAEGLLFTLSEQKNGDYVSRSIYWRHYCALQSGNKLLSESLKNRLIREFPLSYHGLLAQKKTDPLLISPVLVDNDPKLKLRSTLKPSINTKVAAIEWLQVLGAPGLSIRLLDDLEDELEGVEPEFRLYIAILMERAGESIRKFKLLAPLFREVPSLISRSTLEIFYPLKRFDTIRSYQHLVDPYLVAALIRQESGFNENARSPVGARGLMQLMPDTARRVAKVSKRDLSNYKVNIRVGTLFFSSLLKRFNGDPELALAAYNAGPERVEQWTKRYVTSDRVLFMDLIPYKETRDYVALIGRNYYWYLNLYSEGFDRNPASNLLTKQESKKSSPKKDRLARIPARFSLFSSL